METFLFFLTGLALFGLMGFASYKGYLLVENFRQMRKIVWFTKHFFSVLALTIAVSSLAAYLDGKSVFEIVLLPIFSFPIVYVVSLFAIPFGWLIINRYKHGPLGHAERVFGFTMEDIRKLPRKPGDKIWPWPW